jgi:hypothetical protein
MEIRCRRASRACNFPDESLLRTGLNETLRMWWVVGTMPMLRALGLGEYGREGGCVGLLRNADLAAQSFENRRGMCSESVALQFSRVAVVF